MTDLDRLLCRCKGGEPEAFAELFRAYGQDVYRLTATILGDRQDAEDATQEVFLRVYRRIDEYRGEAAFRTWLTAIAVNLCRDRLRRRKLRQALPLDWLNGLAGRETVEATVEQREQRGSLWRQVDRLDGKLRLPVILFYEEGLAADEVAQVLDLPVTTVYARLNTARQRLRTALQGTETIHANAIGKEPC